MAKDMDIIVKLLIAIRESEKEPAFDPKCVGERAVGTDGQNRDTLAIKLKNEGYITGLITTEDTDNVKLHKVLWEHSRPAVTLAGIEYMSENRAFKKALGAMLKAGESAAAAALSAAMGRYL